MDEDDDEGVFGGLYEEGHWVWSNEVEALVFVSDKIQETVEAVQFITKAPTGAVEFRDDVDVIEQFRYRRRYQRKLKPGEPDIITLQDIKDIAIFTAPLSILSSKLIHMLHLPTTERFLRALILWCGYYLQVAEEMNLRMLELETKIRTPVCEILESEYRDNLCDLRLLVAKEYSTMLIGGSDTRKFHHMGPHKKRQSLSDKDARLIETLLRMSVQIVWLALGRKAFNQIELEVNRIFKSEMFNPVEHMLKTNYIAKMGKEERTVLLGHCVRYDKKLNTRSPLMNEIFCHRPIDYRMLGLGIIKTKKISLRLKYMLSAIASPEENLEREGVALGIIGKPREFFDTMLKPLPAAVSTDSKKSVCSQGTISVLAKSSASVKSKLAVKVVYPIIYLPRKETDEAAFPPSFPDVPDDIRPCSEIQLRRWQQRLQRLQNPSQSRSNI